MRLKYYDDMKDAPLSDLLRKTSINNENQLMAFSDYIFQYCTDTFRNTGSSIISYQGGTNEHGTHIPVPVAQSISESEYNASCTTVMALAHFRILIH